MVKQVIFWCAVFVVAAISAVLIGEMGSFPSGSLQPFPLVSTTASASERSSVSDQSTPQRAPNVAKAAEPLRDSDR
jgi:hypothetical protein